MTDLTNIVADLRAEGDELYQFLLSLDESDWSRATTFKSWTINDVVAHLYFGDYLGVTSHQDGQAFKRFMAEVQSSGLTLAEFTRQWLDKLSGTEMLERWRGLFLEMCELFAASDPGLRLTWAGPDMGIQMFATARLMETWAHSWAIYDLLGAPHKQNDRIKHIATIGVKTYQWTFVNRGLTPPGPPPHISLRAPSGERWEWNAEQGDNNISGDAVEFCQVVTQVRNIADTRLKLNGDAAQQWMSIAQCFAGPAEEPPAKGLRTASK
ncbi:MAG: TIGR03084 family protein [Gammaproteobacteria bacterium]|nr:TIGR03084 family protein [Gammaproteobacteria bacterium]MBQ0838396.1 TIGR03084 family protein [Gammaproteobacteria bacterium]